VGSNERARGEWDGGSGGGGVNVGWRNAPLLNTARKKYLPVHAMKLHAPAAWAPGKINRCATGPVWTFGDEKISFLSDRHPSPCLPQGRQGQRRPAARSCPTTTCLYLLGTV